MFDDKAVVEALGAVRGGRVPAGVPERDVTRSPAARRVGELAAAEGLALFHFEHRYALDLPDDWIEPGQEENAAAPRWTDGELPEPKYQSFRHDQILGSFHPGHRGKWSTHELCHGLVGYAWQSGASPLFHATAARLAELLPVVLYYFLDEIQLQRCPLHAGSGPLYRSFCRDCEALAAIRAPEAIDLEHARSARVFLEGELAAIRQTRLQGRPVGYRFGSLDLCTDGLNYAAAHLLRLESPSFHAWIERFGTVGRSTTLDELEDRVVAVARSIAMGSPLDLRVADASAGHAEWARQDLGQRVLTIWEETEGEAADALLALADRLASGAPWEALYKDWEALGDDFELPPADRVFAVGYGEYGRCLPQVRDGLLSVCPLTMELATDHGVDLAGFADPPVREPLGDRFVGWLEANQPHLAGLARFETAVRMVREDPLRRQLGPDGTELRLCDGARVLVADLDLVAVAEQVETGELGADLGEDGRIRFSPTPEPRETGLVMGRYEGELVIAELDPSDARALLASGTCDEAHALVGLGLVRPHRQSIP